MNTLLVQGKHDGAIISKTLEKDVFHFHFFYRVNFNANTQRGQALKKESIPCIKTGILLGLPSASRRCLKKRLKNSQISSGLHDLHLLKLVDMAP